LETLLNRQSSFNNFAVWFDWKTPGLILNGRIMDNMPTSRAALYGPSSELGSTFPVIYKRTLKYYNTNHFIQGWGRVKVKVNLSDFGDDNQ
jgi:hypothetical protein